MSETEKVPPLYQKAEYLTSTAELDQLPPDEGYEVAFIGRSNAGKSSALNVITGIKGLARTSKTPGRTQMINFFALNAEDRLVDLPGYGYAKVPRVIQARWEEVVTGYLQHRKALKGLVIVMDIRHPLKEMDTVIIDWAAQSDIPLHILLTKSDKVSRQVARKTLKMVEDKLATLHILCSLQLFSSLDQTGVDEIKTILDNWYLS